MTPSTSDWALPDPVRDASLYRDVPAKRLVAWVIDSLLIAILTVIAIPFTAFSGLFFLPFLWLLVGLVYRFWSISARSATPGMRLMAIELRNVRGERFGFADAAMHTAIYSLSMSAVVPQIVSIAAMLMTDRRQGLPDLALGSAAINLQR